ncbi:MAG: coproporphyrinogen III oxidase, partial [Prevotella sp.]|nr:coproporphyrinogen III oxidase [Prevotella sp.]
MAGLYLHVPFCKSRCIYCGFYSTTQFSWQSRYVDAVCQEMLIRSLPQLGEVGGGLTSVYLGGGTPSVLTKEQFRQIFGCIEKSYIYNIEKS